MKGKRGPRPEPKRDRASAEMDKPGSFAERTARAAEKHGVKLERPIPPDPKPKAPQSELPIEGAPKPPTVIGRRMLAEFVKPHYSMREGDKRMCGMQFSIALTDEHKPLLPRSVLDAWKFLDHKDGTVVQNIGVEPQTVDVFLASDMAEPELHLPFASVERASLAIIEETGKGAVQRIVRFSFRIVTDSLKNVFSFADTHFGAPYWIQIEETEPELIQE